MRGTSTGSASSTRGRVAASAACCLTRQLFALLLVPAAMACTGSGGSDDDDRRDADEWDGTPMPVDPSCAPVRLTQYWSTDWGWCEFPSNRSFLPSFVQEGLTLAIAEPWNGSSYEGEPGEACGECWEISTAFATEIVMVHDLCPIEGNPLCAGSQFHFDLTPEAATALSGGSNDAAVARRVACPVSGNVHAAVLDWNQWGYLRLSFLNHRIPIRSAELRAAPSGEWRPLERSGGAWQLMDGPAHDAGEGVVFRLRSAQGQLVEGSVVPFQVVSPGAENAVTVDLGMQFDDLEEPVAGQCRFVPDGLVYGDAWGGMEGVEWTPLLWEGTELDEVTEGCHDGGSCLRFELGAWSGFHLYMRQAFPVDSFGTLQAWVRAEGVSAELSIAPSNEGERCTEQALTVGSEWQPLSFDIGAGCGGFALLTSVTVQNQAEPATVFFDTIEFVPTER